MGVDVSGSIRYGCVVDRKDFDAILLANGYDIKEWYSDDLDFLNKSDLDIEVCTSEDLYTCEDWRQEVYIYINSKGTSIGMKRGDIKVLAESDLIISDSVKIAFENELHSIGITKWKAIGWIFRTFLS